MNISPLSDIVSSQYERWMYPEPILDIGKWLISNWQWFDPSHAHPVLWPNGGYRAELDILVAGCGTNQAAVLAYTNPKARIVAIDVSGPSLDHHRFLKTKYGLKNLELVKMPVEDVHLLEGEFDLFAAMAAIVATTLVLTPGTARAGILDGIIQGVMGVLGRSGAAGGADETGAAAVPDSPSAPLPPW
jgi:SAM-dependent methyltransferase